MGDRCWLSVTVRQEDAELLRNLLGIMESQLVDSADGRWETYEEEQANYGLAKERAEAAAEGLVFFGHHNAGCEYGPFLFAAAEGKLEEIPSDQDGYPVVRVHDDGKIDKDELMAVRKYLSCLKLAKVRTGVET